jgi:hypothetical protein
LRLPVYRFVLLFSIVLVASGAAPPVTCPAGSPIGNVDLRVVTPGKSHSLPLRTINRLTEGDTVAYAPILRSGEKRTGEVSLVLAPAIPAAKGQNIIVLNPKPAGKPAEWKITRKIEVAIFVYGPDGLSRGKVQTFLAKDNDLVTQLADYAEKTTQTEALIQALTASDTSPVAVNAALSGFASQYGLSAKMDRTQSADQQAMALFKTVNPALEGSDPLAPGSYQRLGETASLATSIAGLFFGSPVGLAAGGTAMVMDLRLLAFPRTDFRSSLAEKMANDGMALCGKKTPPPPHTKIAYLWASRVPNTAPPTITIGNANSIPATQKSPVPVEIAETDWKYIDRIREWRLVAEGAKPIPIMVKPAGEGKSLELDLSKVKVPPGAYRLAADWDWDTFTANGDLHVQKLGDFGGAHITPVAQDQLIAGKGRVQASLVGGDFEFVTGVQFQKMNDEFSKPAAVPFVLSAGLRRGPQSQLDILLDTKNLEPGKYKLLLTQVDSKAHEVPFDILPPPPMVSNLPVVISRSDRTRQITLKGDHLELLTKLQTPGGSLVLGPSVPDQSERTATFEATSDLKPGSAFEMNAFVAGHTEPITFKNAIHVVGPRPIIENAKLSPPSEISIPLQPGEVAAGVFLSGMLQVKNLEPSSGVQLSCEGQDGNVASLRMGEHSSSASLQLLAVDQVFLSFDTSRWPAGCTIQARIDNGPDGLSEACRLGRLVRFPHVDSFQVISSETEAGVYLGELVGTDLQNIEKIGWDANNGFVVTDLPSPIPGAGMKQSLNIKLPAAEPMPHAPLYLWLRGDQQGRATNIHD